jgi:SpoVK/Ycf46/Vps4 family AAA+-type ATPase
MGNSHSKKIDDKETRKRFKKEFSKVEKLIEEAKQREEEMDFQESSGMYMQALKILHTFLDEYNLPEDITLDLSMLAADMIKKREHLIEYQKMHDIATNSYKEDNKRFNEEDGKETNTVSEDEEDAQDLKMTIKEMIKVYHRADETNKRDFLTKLNRKQRFQLECEILNRKLDFEGEESDEENESVENSVEDNIENDEIVVQHQQEDSDNESISYEEPEMHFTDIKEVEKACSFIEKKEDFCRENFDSESDYVFAITEEILKSSNIWGITPDQLAPLVNKVVWMRHMKERKEEKNSEWSNKQLQEQIKNIAQKYENEINELREEIQCKNQKKGDKKNDNEKELKEIEEGLMKKLQKPGRDMDGNETFDNIIGLKSVKRALETGIQAPLQHPELVASGDLNHYDGLLLFGPPGTGKSMIAKALANEAKNCSFIQVDRSDLVSKWQGQSEKCVNVLFKIARKHKPCIVFIDEIEGLLEDRDAGESSNGAKVVTVLLTAMQNLGRDKVFVLGASNYPWKLDKAFLRRFSQIIYVPLPNLGERVKILTSNIASTDNHNISIQDIENIALLTDKYSGSHLHKVVKAARAIRYERVCRHQYFKRSIKGKDYWQPCSKEEQGAKRMSAKSIPKLVMPPLLMEDLEMALYEIKNNTDQAYIKKLITWGNKNSNMPEEEAEDEKVAA